MQPTALVISVRAAADAEALARQDKGTAVPENVDPMSIEELSAEQLERLKSIHARKQELVDERSRDFRELLILANAAATRRSETRYRFMLLAGGIVGVAVPVLLQNAAGINTTLARIGSVLLLINIIVGAVFDALDERRTNPILRRIADGNRTLAQLNFAQDARVISAQPGQPEPFVDGLIEEARAKNNAADLELRKDAADFAKLRAFELRLFFGTFVLGLLVLLLAVGAAG